MLICPPGDDGIIPRCQMPQVDDKYLGELLVHIGTYGVPISAGKVDPKTVKAHQEVDVDRCRMIPIDVLSKPCLLSKEGYIIDGDHRWYRHVMDETMMPIIKFDALFKDAVKIIFEFPHTYREEEA